MSKDIIRNPPAGVLKLPIHYAGQWMLVVLVSLRRGGSEHEPNEKHNAQYCVCCRVVGFRGSLSLSTGMGVLRLKLIIKS